MAPSKVGHLLGKEKTNLSGVHYPRTNRKIAMLILDKAEFTAKKKSQTMGEKVFPYLINGIK